MIMFKRIATLLAALMLLLCSSPLFAADYPSKPIEVIIPYAAGSNSDNSGRIFINAMRKALGSPLVAINVAGAGGTVGMARLAQADPDGYTIGFSPIAPVTIQPHVRNLPYGQNSFEPICLVADNPIAITVAPDSPYKTIDDLIKAAKKGKVVAVGNAPGSIPHIAQSALAKAYGVKFTYLPAGGGGAAAKAVLGGEATFAADTSAMVTVYGLRALAVLSDKRMAEFPNVPTLKELGKNLRLTVWFGTFAPKGTPEAMLNKLSAAASKAVQDPKFLEAMKQAHFIVRFMPRSEFTAFYNNQYQDNKKLLQMIGVKAK